MLQRIDVYCTDCNNKLFDCDPTYLTNVISSTCSKCGKDNRFPFLKSVKRKLNDKEILEHIKNSVY